MIFSMPRCLSWKSRSVLLLDHDVARLRREFRMPLAAPHALPEEGFAIDQGLAGARVTPSVVIALAPPSMRYVEHYDTSLARRLDECAKMRN
jgi:hypothetical protein